MTVDTSRERPSDPLTRQRSHPPGRSAGMGPPVPGDVAASRPARGVPGTARPVALSALHPRLPP